MKKILVTLAMLTIAANSFCMQKKEALSLLGKVNKAISMTSEFKQNPVNKSFTITKLDNESITKVELVKQKGEYITLSVFFKTDKPKFFDIKKLGEEAKRKLNLIIDNIQTFHKVKTGRTSIDKASEAQSLRENPLGAMMGEEPEHIKKAWKELEALQVEYNKLFEKDKMTGQDRARKEEIENKADELNKIIEEHQQEGIPKYKMEREGIKQGTYTEAMEIFKKMRK